MGWELARRLLLGERRAILRKPPPVRHELVEERRASRNLGLESAVPGERLLVPRRLGLRVVSAGERLPSRGPVRRELAGEHRTRPRRLGLRLVSLGGRLPTRGLLPWV